MNGGRGASPIFDPGHPCHFPRKEITRRVPYGVRLEEWRRENDTSWRPGPLTDKRCACCGEWLPVESFPVLPAKSKGEPWRRWKLGSWCRPCKRAATRGWREANRERIAESRRTPPARLTCSECGAAFEGRKDSACLLQAVSGRSLSAPASGGVPREGAAEGRAALGAAEGGGVIERLLTARELAELLGLSASTVLDWFEAGTLPGFKLGRVVRFRESEIAEWLEAKRTTRARGAA